MIHNINSANNKAQQHKSCLQGIGENNCFYTAFKSV